MIISYVTMTMGRRLASRMKTIWTKGLSTEEESWTSCVNRSAKFSTDWMEVRVVRVAWWFVFPVIAGEVVFWHDQLLTRTMCKGNLMPKIKVTLEYTVARRAKVCSCDLESRLVRLNAACYFQIHEPMWMAETLKLFLKGFCQNVFESHIVNKSKHFDRILNNLRNLWMIPWTSNIFIQSKFNNTLLIKRNRKTFNKSY